MGGYRLEETISKVDRAIQALSEPDLSDLSPAEYRLSPKFSDGASVGSIRGKLVAVEVALEAIIFENHHYQETLGKHIDPERGGAHLNRVKDALENPALRLERVPAREPEVDALHARLDGLRKDS